MGIFVVSFKQILILLKMNLENLSILITGGTNFVKYDLYKK